MIPRNQLIDFIYDTVGDEWIQKAMAQDDLTNGLQITGGPEVDMVTLGVSANEELFTQAAANGSNFCIFHHALDMRTYKSRVPIYTQKRLRQIFTHNITVMGFHGALDIHPEIGNNAVIIRELGAKLGEPLFEGWGYTATFSKPQNVKDLSKKCSKLFEHDIFAVFTGPAEVETIGVVSGGAKPYAQHIAEMEDLGVELFITGESAESVPHKMKESGINYFAGGHYATEVFGVQELGKKIKAEFKEKLAVEFLDIPNPI